MQQMPQGYSNKQDCDLTQSFYYENGKPHCSSQTTIIQQTLQNHQMNPISFKNKFQQEPKPQYNQQFYNHPIKMHVDHLTPQQRISNQENMSQIRINTQNDNILNQRIQGSKEYQNCSDKQGYRTDYENQIIQYQNDIQQSNQTVSGRKMNEDIFQTKQNSNKNSLDQNNLHQNILSKDQQQRINVLLQNPYVMERNLNAGAFETYASDSTTKQQQQINQGLSDGMQLNQNQEIQNSIKQNLVNQNPPLKVELEQNDEIIQRQILELKSKNNEQKKQNINIKRRFSTKSVKIKSGKSFRDISDINFNEVMSGESKFEEDPQYLDDEYGRKGSNSEIKNCNQNLPKYSQFKNSQIENQKEISDDKSNSQKPSSNQLKLKLLQKLQQANNTKSHDISLQGPSEIKQLSSKTSLQNNDKVGINKSDIEKIKQKSLNKFDNNSTKVDPIVKMLQQKSREESLIENKDKVNSKDTLSSKKRCNSLKIQDSLIEHVRLNGFQEGFSKQNNVDSPQITKEKQSQLPPIIHSIAFQNKIQNNPQDTSSTSYMQKSLHQNDKIQLYNIISQENLPDIPMYSQKRMQQLGSKLSIKSSNLFAYSDTRSLIHPNQIQDLPFYQSIDRVNSKIFEKNQEKDCQKNIDQVNIINQRIEEEISKNQRNYQNQQLTTIMDRWGLKIGADTGVALNKLIHSQSKNPDAKKPIDLQQNGFILKENKIQKNLETFKTTQNNENKNANFMKPSIGKQKQNKTPNYSKEKKNQNSKDKKKMKQNSYNEDNQTSSSLSLSFTYNQTITQNDNTNQKDNESNNKIKFVGLSEQINLDTSLTPNQNPHTPIQNAKKIVQKQVENIKNIPQAVKIQKDIQIQLNQLIQVKSGSFQESGGNEVYSFKTPIVKNRQLKTKSYLLKKPSFENNMKSSQGDNLKSLLQSSHDKDQMLFKNSNNLSSIRNSDDINKIQTDSFELNKEKVIVSQMPPVNLLNQDCKTVINNKDETELSDYSGKPAPKRQLERTYSDISQISNNLYPETKKNNFDDMKTLINARHNEDNQSSLSAIQPCAPLRETEKSHSDISYVSRFGYLKKLGEMQLNDQADIKTIQNHNQNDFDKDSSNSAIQAPQRMIERTLSDISQISQISKISNNLPNALALKPKNQFENIPKLKKDRSSKVPKHKQSKKQVDEYFVMKNQITDLSITSIDKQQKQNDTQDQFQDNKSDTLNKINNYQLQQYQNIYKTQKIIENNYLQQKKGESFNKNDDLRGKDEKQINKKSSLNLPINSIYGKPALSYQSSMGAINKQNSKYTASFTLNKDSVVISQKSASSFKEDNQINVVQSWSAQNTFGHINSGFYLKNPSKDLPRIEISEEDEDQIGTTPVKEKEQNKQIQSSNEDQDQIIVHIADVEPGTVRRMSLTHQDEPIKINNIFQLRRGILENQPEMSEKNSTNALAQSGFFGRYSSNPNLLNFKFQ